MVAHDMIMELIRPEMNKVGDDMVEYMAYVLEALCTPVEDNERYRKYGSITNAQS